MVLFIAEASYHVENITIRRENYSPISTYVCIFFVMANPQVVVKAVHEINKNAQSTLNYL